MFSRGETVTLHICKNTQKSKFLLSKAFKWKKIMFFVILEITPKTFVMILKKLPDHFKVRHGLISNDSYLVILTNTKSSYSKPGNVVVVYQVSIKASTIGW